MLQQEQQLILIDIHEKTKNVTTTLHQIPQLCNDAATN